MKQADIGLIGLAVMGENLVLNMESRGHTVAVFNRTVSKVDDFINGKAKGKKIIGTHSIKELVDSLKKPRRVMLMVKAGKAVDDFIDQLIPILEPGDIIIDGGNSYFKDDARRSIALREKQINYVDVGTSGGVFGLERGFCLMIGGEDSVVSRLDPIFDALAPGAEAASPTPGRADARSTAGRGYLHCGPVGAGHFVKMVHNGIEYGLMAAYAEGLNVLKHANAGATDREPDAETAPLRDPEFYRYDIDVAEVAELWRRGSVVSSWLLDLTATALAADPALESFSGRVSDSGEGRWTIAAAVDEGVPVHVLSAALFDRFESRAESEFANRMLSAMRKEFGGHEEKPA